MTNFKAYLFLLPLLLVERTVEIPKKYNALSESR
jgi:hypothetical protein